MPTNDFLQFATGGSANVESQAAYSADSNRTNGNQPGVASSAFNNKAIRQAGYVASNVAQMMSDFMGVDVLDDTISAKFLSTLKAAVQALAPVITKYASGSGTHNVTYYFFIASGNATAAATYTNNGITYTVSSTVAAATLVKMTGSGAPTASGTLTKSGGTGDATLTFYAVRAPLSIDVIMVGGGGGGGGGGSTAPQGTAGGNTTFGTTLLVANGGGVPSGSYGSIVPSVGGTASLGTGPFGIALQGASGQGANFSSTNAAQMGGSIGGASPFGGAGGGGSNNSAGSAAITNSGSGGGGGGGGNSAGNSGGAGGAAGGYVNATINTPLSTYAYAVGAAGNAGAAGTNGFAGAAGGSGVILVKENFQ